MESSTYEKLLQTSFRFVSYRPRSEKEIRDFLKKKLVRWKTAATATVPKVIDRLREYGYVDDAKFALWWIDQRQTHNPKGHRLIEQELFQKGVDKELIAQQFELRQFSPGREKVDIVSDIALAKKTIQKKLSSWKKLPKQMFLQKVYGFLGRRGFDTDTIGRIVDEMVASRVQ